ncbi:MAG: AzlD domain-containing protein [Treponema succinifaciens]|nr:MAG: AzlD domain-containing protein [Treponema succinifaciens]
MERACFLFVAFSRKNPPAIIRFIEKYTPSLIMAVLVVYCFKDTSFLSSPFGIPHLAASVATVVIHLLFKNSMVSIFSGTIIFMVFVQNYVKKLKKFPV